MPRRFFRKFAFKRDHLSKQWYMAPFRHLLHDHRLWSVRRRTVVPAFALGVLIAWLPFPGHMIAAALLALALRISIPVAVAAVWVCNPLTVAPMYYFAYRFGRIILDVPVRPFSFEFSVDWLTHSFITIWEPLLLGCVLLGLATAIVGYVVLDLFWRWSLVNYITAKRNRRRDRHAN